MASGKTVEMVALSRVFRWGSQPERPKRERDRTLSGKARRRARRAAKHG